MSAIDKSTCTLFMKNITSILVILRSMALSLCPSLSTSPSLPVLTYLVLSLYSSLSLSLSLYLLSLSLSLYFSQHIQDYAILGVWAYDGPLIFLFLFPLPLLENGLLFCLLLADRVLEVHFGPGDIDAMLLVAI